MAAFQPFKLSAQLSGHSGDVRAVVYRSGTEIISTSRDKTIRQWAKPVESSPAYESAVIGRSDFYVNIAAVVPPSEKYPAGLVISSGADAVIQVHEPRSEKEQSEGFPIAIPGHESNCTAIAVSPEGSYFVSGGWDTRAQVVRTSDWIVEAMLDGHTGAVTAVLPVDEQTVLTGCNDGVIRCFTLSRPSGGAQGKLAPVRKLTMPSPQPADPPSAVRALCRLPSSSGADFASASNDLVIRLWNFDGQQLQELRGHESFVYSLAALPSGEIVSSSEDRTLRVWQGNRCMQTITHPTESVWSVAVSPEFGDIVSGASDGDVRVWTRSAERVADAATVKSFEDAVKQSAIPQQTLGDLDNEAIPGAEFLTSRSGTKDGQVQVVKLPDGSKEAHMWSTAENKWNLIGSVVDGPASSTRKKIPYKGKEWDYLLPVDVEEGKPPLQLPYNVSEEPYTAARRFLEDNELPISYLEEVARHIDRETKGAHFAYTSSGQTATRPDAQPSSVAASVYFPQKDYVFLTSLKSEPLLKKVGELNDSLIQRGSKEHALNPSSISTLKRFVPELESFVNDHPATLPSNGTVSDSEFSRFGELDAEINLVVKMAREWDYANRLPGLDLLRCLAVFPQATAFRHPTHGNILEIALSSALENPSGDKPTETCVMMCMRAVVNIFATKEGRQLAIPLFPRVVSIIEAIVGAGDQSSPFKGPLGLSNRNIMIATASVGINYAVLASSPPKDGAGGALPQDTLMQLVNCLGVIIQESRDAATLSRVLAAVGTLAHIDNGMRANIKGLGGASWARLAKDRSPDVQVVNRAAELVELLG